MYFTVRIINRTGKFYLNYGSTIEESVIGAVSDELSKVKEVEPKDQYYCGKVGEELQRVRFKVINKIQVMDSLKKRKAIEQAYGSGVLSLDEYNNKCDSVSTEPDLVFYIGNAKTKFSMK